MGRSIEQESFEPEDFERFSERLEVSLIALRRVLARPRFGRGPASLGAELELSLVDGDRRPAFANEAVIQASRDPRIAEELNLFNLECNLKPTPFSGRPFAALASEMDDALSVVRRAAHARGVEVAAIGILPTLDRDDLEATAMTPRNRYRALSAALRDRRHEPFRVRIDGEDPLEATCREITFEGAATSLQIHLRVTPDRYAAVYNGVQAATAPVLAICGNSPTFLGHRLWDETRVALFKQAVDDRTRDARRRDRQARVSFGTAWLRDGAYELFEEGVALHPPLLPALSEEDPLGRVEAGGTPALEEMRLHLGTVWHWNRPIYDPAADGHLRIEMRALPAGPSVPDMVANAALLIGLGLGFADEAEGGAAPIWSRLSFEEAHSNFYRAAQSGFAAKLQWPGSEPTRAAPELLETLLPVAASGLESAGIDAVEIEAQLAVVRHRLEARMSGARWQRAWLAYFDRKQGRDEARAAMLDRYLAEAATGRPVHEWALP